MVRKPPRRGRWIAIGLVAGILLSVASSMGVRSFLRAMQGGNIEELARRPQDVTERVARYKELNGIYPLACDARGLFAALAGLGETSLTSASNEFLYCSDGTTYTLVYLPAGSGPHAEQPADAMVVRDGTFVVWPESASKALAGRTAPESRPSDER